MKDISQNVISEEAIPYPEFLIKSISEQGYSLETSLADLIDNSISAGAKKIEILVNTEKLPFTLFLADDGCGMSEDTLRQCMQFPSTSLEYDRNSNDLGRFGLGMKTASFAQTRRFTVISRPNTETQYAARTWDVDFLKKEKNWKIIVNSQEEITKLLSDYKSLEEDFLNGFDEYYPNTIILWQGLYKFEDYLDGDDRSASLKTQITESTIEYLSLVFHRFMERGEKPLSIRVNNVRVKPFNPFPTDQRDLRLIESRQRTLKKDVITLEGFVLPARSIEESKASNNTWTTQSKGLLDMEGLYIYRADRIILFGGWNGIIRKSPRLQLARLRVEVGNKIDQLLHLNVAKSQISIPYDLKIGFLKYMSELKQEAEKEYYNRGIRTYSSKKSDALPQLFERKASNRGTLLEINTDFPLIKIIMEGLDEKQQRAFWVFSKMINTNINKIRQVHEDKTNINANDESAGDALLDTIKTLLENQVSKQVILESILPSLGYRIDLLPSEIISLLK